MALRYVVSVGTKEMEDRLRFPSRFVTAGNAWTERELDDELKTKKRFREILDTRLLEVEVPHGGAILNTNDKRRLRFFFAGQETDTFNEDGLFYVRAVAVREDDLLRIWKPAPFKPVPFPSALPSVASVEMQSVKLASLYFTSSPPGDVTPANFVATFDARGRGLTIAVQT